MSADIRSIGEWNDNAELIADVANLGYIGDDVLDMTYGLGVFWQLFLPRGNLVRNDINPAKGAWHHDVTAGIPAAWIEAFDTVVYDPPYRMQGTADKSEFTERYGIDDASRWQDRCHLICDGAYNGAKAVKPNGTLLVKVQNQVVSGSKVWQTDLVCDTVGRRCQLIDQFHLMSNGRPQRSQVHSRSNYSTLLVFRRKDRLK